MQSENIQTLGHSASPVPSFPSFLDHVGEETLRLPFLSLPPAVGGLGSLVGLSHWTGPKQAIREPALTIVYIKAPKKEGNRKFQKFREKKRKPSREDKRQVANRREGANCLYALFIGLYVFLDHL